MNRNSFAALCTATVIALGMGASSNCQAGVFGPGEFITYSDVSWGGDPGSSPAAALLVSDFGTVYPFSFVEVGISGAAGFSMIFTSAASVLNYLPAGGVPGPLTSDLVDPGTTAAGVFGGTVLALQLNVDFTDAGVLTGSAGIPFGDLIFHDLTLSSFGGDLSVLNGLSVRQYLIEANTALGGGGLPPSFLNYDDMTIFTIDLIQAFDGGTPSQFAQDHLMVIPAPGSIAALAMLGVPGLGRPHRRRAA